VGRENGMQEGRVRRRNARNEGCCGMRGRCKEENVKDGRKGAGSRKQDIYINTDARGR
jgi:hypothetical protein